MLCIRSLQVILLFLVHCLHGFGNIQPVIISILYSLCIYGMCKVVQLMTKDSVSSDPNRLVEGVYDTNLPPTRTIFGNILEQKQKCHL